MRFEVVDIAKSSHSPIIGSARVFHSRSLNALLIFCQTQDAYMLHQKYNRIAEENERIMGCIVAWIHDKLSLSPKTAHEQLQPNQERVDYFSFFLLQIQRSQLPSLFVGKKALTGGAERSARMTSCGSSWREEEDERSTSGRSACRSCICWRAPSARAQ